MANKESAQNLDEFSKAVSGKEGIKWSDYEKIQNIKKEDISKTKTYIDNEIKRIQSLPQDQQTDLGSWEGYRASIDTIEKNWKSGALTITQHKEESHNQTLEKTKAKLVEFFGSKPVAPAIVEDTPASAAPAPVPVTPVLEHKDKTVASDLKATKAEIFILTPQQAITTLNTTFADKKFDMKNFGKSFEKSCETVEFYNAVATLVRLELIQGVEQCTPINIRTLRAATQTLQEYLGITEDGAFGPETLRAYQNSKNTKDLKEFLALTPEKKIENGFHSIKKNTVASTKPTPAPVPVTHYGHEGKRTGPIGVDPTPITATPAKQVPAPTPVASGPAKQTPASATKQTPASAPKQTPASAPKQTPASAPNVPVTPAPVASSTVIKATSAQAPTTPASAPAPAPAQASTQASAQASVPAKPASAPQKTPEVLPQGLSPISNNIYQDKNFTYTLSDKTCTITQNNNSKIDIIINGGKINLLEPIKEFLLKQGIATVTATKEGLTVTSTIRSI